jgi:hypothetical protein
MTLLLFPSTGNSDVSMGSMVPPPTKQPAKKQKKAISVTPRNQASVLLQNNNSKENTILMHAQTETA